MALTKGDNPARRRFKSNTTMNSYALRDAKCDPHPIDTGADRGAMRQQFYWTNRRMNARAVSATWRQPLSITSACPRLGISTISVTPWLRFSRL